MFRYLLAIGILAVATGGLNAQDKMKALIVEGQNNHGNWPQTSQMMKQYLLDTNLFEVDIVRTAEKGTDENFQPEFSEYKVVLSNYNGAAWPQATKTAFVEYVKGGGGFVVVHAANNAFGDWSEYNQIIGLGGWGGRNRSSGPYVYFDQEKQQLVRDDRRGRGGHHGRQHPFRIIVRNSDHPITRGMPNAWMHVNDELYDSLRGPAENMNVLATAFANPETGGSGKHEPMIFTVDYGKGRVFHTPLGHGNDSQQCVGFITSLQRGAEWAATGNVTQDLPDDFPTVDETRSRVFQTNSK